MSRVIKIRLTPENASVVRALQEHEPVDLDDLVNRALSDYLFRLRFEQLRARLSQPGCSEEEILELVS